MLAGCVAIDGAALADTAEANPTASKVIRRLTHTQKLDRPQTKRIDVFMEEERSLDLTGALRN
jgi:hypothetical protein